MIFWIENCLQCVQLSSLSMNKNTKCGWTKKNLSLNGESNACPSTHPLDAQQGD